MSTRLGLLLAMLALAACGPKPSPASSVGENSAVAVDTGASRTEGTLDAALIRDVITRHWNSRQLNLCYARHSTLPAKVLVHFVIEPDGHVSHAQMTSSNLNNVEVERCIEKTFLKFEFPKPTGGVVTIDFPLEFSTRGTR